MAPTLPLALSWLDVAVPVVGFSAVVAGVVAVFGQRGRAEVSPQRRVAIATGQADRQTVFESSVWGPLAWGVLKLTERLSAVRTKQWLDRTLIAAGSPNFYSADEYLALSLLWALALASVLAGLDFLANGTVSAIGPVAGLLTGLVLPMYVLHDRARKRVREIARRVPYSLDLISLAMGAGSTFTEAVRTVIREDPDHPLNRELATVLAEMDLGATRRGALVSLAGRIPLESLRAIVASINQSEDLGTPLTGVLASQAVLLRLQRSVRAEKLAALASVRILVPSVLILLSVVLTVFCPFIVRAIRGELF